MNRNNIYKVFILLSFLCLSASIKAQIYIEDISTLVHKTHAERTIQLTPFYNEGIRYLDSSQVFTTINKIRSLSRKSNDYALELETKLMDLHYYSYRDYFKKEFVVNKITALNQLAKTKKVLWLEIRTHSLLANYLYSFHRDYGLGFEHYERTAQLLENVSGDEFPLKQICLYQLGNAYHTFREYKNAIKFLIKAKSTKSSLNSYYYDMHIHNHLGDSYRNIKSLDSSYYYFNVTLQKALKADDRVWEGISSGNIGYNNFLEGKLETAQPLIELDAKIAIENEDWGLATNALALLSKIQLSKNNISKAYKLSEEASLYARKSGQYRRFALVFPLQSKIATYQFKPELSIKYADSAVVVKDSLAKLYDARKLIRAQQRIEIEKQKFQDEKEDQEQSKQLLIRNGFIVILLLLITIIILFYNRYRLRVKNKEQLAFQELQTAVARLENFKTSIINKNKIIAQLEQKFKKSDNNEGGKKSEIEAQLELELELEKATILTDKDWLEFTVLFEQAYPGFFKRLKVKYPKLTPSETRMITLSKLQLTNKEMALMLGVGIPAIRQVKSRLQKKINLNKGNTLLDMILKI
jgi:hypothetical protein